MWCAFVSIRIGTIQTKQGNRLVLQSFAQLQMWETTANDMVLRHPIHRWIGKSRVLKEWKYQRIDIQASYIISSCISFNTVQHALTTTKKLKQKLLLKKTQEKKTNYVDVQEFNWMSIAGSIIASFYHCKYYKSNFHQVFLFTP